MSVNGTTRGGRLGSTSQYRLVPARKNRSRGRLGLENEPTAFAAAHRRVRVRSVATVPAVATVKIDRGRQYRPSSLARALNNPAENARRFRECRPRHYPASLASDEGAFGSGTPCARHSPVTGPASNRLVQSFGALLPAHWGPQAPLNAAPPLARELEARVAVAGKACGLSGQP